MRFSVEPRILDHFGIAMYSSVQKAIAELCANAYDADASVVRVGYTDDEIRIVDNGGGMTPDEVENSYLRLGRDRRGETGERTARGRPVIGNKGIGKLAGFGIADEMTVRTWTNDTETVFTLRRHELDAVRTLEEYDISPKVRKVTRKTSGTEIVLRGRHDDRHAVDEKRLREHLARHLPARPGWKIKVNGLEARPADIRGERYEIDEPVEGFGRVRGYYVVASDRRKLAAGFAIRVRDRIVQESSLFGLNQQEHGWFNMSRIVGELEPDFIDPLSGGASKRQQFVITTNRSGFNEEDPAVEALFEFARAKLRSIAKGLADQRAQERKQAAFRRNPQLEARLTALGPDTYAKLNSTLDTFITRLSKNEDEETVDQIVDMIIRYYESDAMRIILDRVGQAAPDEVERLSALLAEYGTAVITEVTGILHSQLEVIELLRSKVSQGVLEKEIHHIIAKNIWLLRDDLTFWFENRSFARMLGDRLAERFQFAGRRRPDLACYDDRPLQSRPGSQPRRLVVVEFKRPGVEVGLNELTQVMSYKAVFQASLGDLPPDGIEIVVVGDSFDQQFDREALGTGYRMLSYEELLASARDRYRELYDRLRPPSEGEDDDEDDDVGAEADSA